MKSKAEGRKRKADAGILRLPAALCLVLSAFLFLSLTTGCSDTSSPAAPPPAMMAASSSDAGNSPPVNSAGDESKKPARDVTFDTIKFEMQKDEPFQRAMITPAIERLDKSKIRIRGYILPSVEQTLTRFVLVRDNMQCCFGPGAALFDCIVVEMDAGRTTEFTTQPVAVEGTFSINEYRNDEGKCLAIYHMQAEKVR